MVSTSLRQLPAVHRLLASPALDAARDRYGHAAVRDAWRAVIATVRGELAAREPGPAPGGDLTAELGDRVLARLEVAGRDAFATVVNATGVLLHTNLGRAPLASAGGEAGYLALEYDLDSGARGQRVAPLRAHISATCGGAWAEVVNNNAASLLLILAGWASGREVVVSRGELVEIGGSFRLPEVMAAAGCRLVEVGCTNRTHLADYAAAIGPDTAAVLVVHRSNFRVVGFTASADLAELAELAHRHGLPLIVDQGSGCLHDLRRWGLTPEATVAELLAAGADVVCFSGDKLLGGPQAGLIVGQRAWVEPLGRHPLYRALRLDKTALTGLDRVLAAHRSGHLEHIPLYALLAVPAADLARRARRIARALGRAGVPASACPTRATLGGGTTPDETLPSWGIAVSGGQALAELLRRQSPPVLARVENDQVVMDLRAVPAASDELLIREVVPAYTRLQAIHDSGR